MNPAARSTRWEISSGRRPPTGIRGATTTRSVNCALKVDGAPQDVGNGFLFRDYDAGGLWYALEKSVAFHRMPAEVREKQIRRIMREAREQYSLDHMVAEYIRIYEKLNGGRPLV